MNSSPTSPSSSDEHVFERDQPGRAAEFVDDERLVRAALAQVTQHPVDGDALVHARDRPDDAFERVALPAPLTSQRTRSLVCSMPTMLSIESR